MNQQWRGRLIRYTPFVLWTGLVLGLGTGGASMNRTSRIIRPLLEFLFPGAPESTLVFYHGLIRKSAHFFEYAILALLAVRAFKGSAKAPLRIHPLIFSVLVAAAVAVVDESLQSLDPSRTASAFDVLIDLTGALCAAGLAFLIAGRSKN